MLNIIRPLLQRLTNFVPSYGLPMLLASYSASTPNNVSQMGLEEFFDLRENWGNASVRSGRPWRKDELRIKSNADLHKLWYVLLKERNMLMTMEAEHYRCLERMPNPERLEKVEESMENLLLVVEERNRAEADLEHGEWVGPTMAEGIDALGRPCSRLTSEHLEPRVGDKTAKADEQMWGEKTVELLRLEEETYKSKDRKTTRSERVTQRKKRWNRLDYFNATSSDKTPM